MTKKSINNFSFAGRGDHSPQQPQETSPSPNNLRGFGLMNSKPSSKRLKR